MALTAVRCCTARQQKYEDSKKRGYDHMSFGYRVYVHRTTGAVLCRNALNAV